LLTISLGFVGTTAGTMFILRMLQEKYSQKNKKLNHVFVDLEKAFD